MEAPTIGMTAKEAREKDIFVHDSVPDVATFQITNYSQRCTEVTDDGAVVVTLEAFGIWQWVELAVPSLMRK